MTQFLILSTPSKETLLVAQNFKMNGAGPGKGRMIQNTFALGLQHHAYRPRLKQTGLLTYFFRQGLKIAIDHQRYCGL